MTGCYGTDDFWTALAGNIGVAVVAAIRLLADPVNVEFSASLNAGLFQFVLGGEVEMAASRIQHVKAI